MELTELSSEMWLDRIENLTDRVKAIVERYPSELQPIVLEALLKRALSTRVFEPLEPSADRSDEPLAPPSPTSQPIVETSGPMSPRYGSFLHDFGISHAEVDRLLNVRTGEILARNLGRGGADIQRKIAALVALWNGANGREMDASPDEIMRHSRTFGVNDSANMAAAMKRAVWDGTRVFTNENGRWRVTKQGGEDFVAAVVKDLLQPSSERS